MEMIRAFIAIRLSPAILAALEDVQDRLKQDLPSGLVRWVRPEGIHLTLQFLGDTPAARLEPIAAALAAACAPYAPFHLALQGTGCFPNQRRPRVVWVGVGEPSGALARLQHDVERALAPLGFTPEDRSFTPHLTLGRVKGGDPGALDALGAGIARVRVRAGEMDVRSVHLIQSQLLPGGAVYTSLAEAPLTGTQI